MPWFEGHEGLVGFWREGFLEVGLNDCFYH